MLLPATALHSKGMRTLHNNCTISAEERQGASHAALWGHHTLLLTNRPSAATTAVSDRPALARHLDGLSNFQLLGVHSPGLLAVTASTGIGFAGLREILRKVSPFLATKGHDPAGHTERGAKLTYYTLGVHLTDLADLTHDRIGGRLPSQC